MSFELQFGFDPNSTSRKQEGSFWKEKKNFEAYHIKFMKCHELHNQCSKSCKATILKSHLDMGVLL